VSVVFALIILVFRALNNKSVIDAIYTIASYTYGPLLGLYAFGLFTKWKIRDHAAPFICIIAPLICFVLDCVTTNFTTYRFGYELLMLNGLLTFTGLLVFRKSLITK